MPRLWGDAANPGRCPGVGAVQGDRDCPRSAATAALPEPQPKPRGVLGRGTGPVLAGGVQAVQPPRTDPHGKTLGPAGDRSGGDRARCRGSRGARWRLAAGSQPSVSAATSPPPSRGSPRGSPRPAAPGLRTALAAARSRRLRPHGRRAGAASRGDPEGPARLPRDRAPTGPGEQEWPGPSPAAGSSLRPPRPAPPPAPVILTLGGRAAAPPLDRSRLRSQDPADESGGRGREVRSRHRKQGGN